MLIQGVTLTGTYITDNPPAITTGLQQYYDIGDSGSYSGLGATVIDLANGGYGNGTLVSSPTYTSAGNRSYLSFNGSSSYFYTPNLYTMASGTLNSTMEVWVRTSSDNGVVVDEQGNIPFNSGWHDAQIEIISGVLKGTYWGYNAITGPSVTRNVWQQYVLTYNVSTSTQTLYINGASVGNKTSYTRSFAGSVLHLGVAGPADFTTLGDGTLLACDWSIFRVYNRALTADEVLQNYRATSWRYS